MRLRRIKGIEEKIKEYSDVIVFDSKLHKGKWKELFQNDNPIELEIGNGQIRDYCGPIRYAYDHQYFRRYCGPIIYQYDRENIREYCGPIFMTFDGRYVRKYCGPIIYEISNNQIRTYCGPIIYQVDGIMRHEDWMALIIYLFA